MATISKLIDILKTKEPDTEVEFIVVKKNTMVVCMDLTDDVCDQDALLRTFKRPAKNPTKATAQ